MKEIDCQEVARGFKNILYYYYGLPVVVINEEEYAIAKDEEEAYRGTCGAILESLWAFNVEFILSECELECDEDAKKAFREMLGKVCEGGNAFVNALIAGTCGLEKFCQDAIAADGRGHFLATYDGKEVKVKYRDHENFLYLYRIN